MKLHPKQNLHWQHRNLYGCDIDRVMSEVTHTARNGLTNRQRGILDFVKEKVASSYSGIARRHFGISDFRDYRLRDIKQEIEVLAVLGWLKRSRSKQKWKSPLYSTPQATTLYRVNPTRSWEKAD